MKLIFLGHATFQLVIDGHEVLIDPFLSENPVAPIGPEEVNPSHIVLTHGHGDHYGDTEAIAKRCGSTVISSVEIANYVAKKGIASHPANVGGSVTLPFGRVTFTPAWHSSSLPDGSYGGMPMGVIIEAEGKRIYHAGDTSLFGDMQLIGRGGLDVALLPIGDNFTMGPDNALEAVRLLKPKLVTPIHYNTFELVNQDADAFKERVEDETESSCLLLAPGEYLEL
ncbi:MAG: metal-dependent hydrolase [Trueperaceae bacterium]|nr:MAG: metal-dependent hydrolase [Trueperaceae bacterium]